MALCRTSRVMSIGLFADYEKSIVLFEHERASPFILTINSQQRLSYKFNLLSYLNYTFLTASIKHQSSSSFITFTEDFQSELFKPNTHLLLTVLYNHSTSMYSAKNDMVSSNENWKKASGKTKRGKPVGRREVLEKHKAIAFGTHEYGKRKQLGTTSRVLVSDSDREVKLVAQKFPEESFKKPEGKVRKSHESRGEADFDYGSQIFQGTIELWDIIECELCFRTMHCSTRK